MATMLHNLNSQLNPPQRDAVTTVSGPLLVLAGAGTGKTRVITYRMIELIRRGVSPEKILSVTFTNKAAREMLERTALLLGKKTKKKPLISTFHSLCVRILRQEITALDYPANFTIYDRGDQESTARTALRAIRIGDEAMRPADLINRISQWKMKGITPEQASDYSDNDFDFLAAMAYRRYQKQLRANAAVDFDDLLLLTHQLFQKHPEVLQRQQQRFDHVQVDEYQDTNSIQFDLVEALVRTHQNLCVVGDDDQSIYGWRGAEVRHILGFQSHFPKAKIVRLEDNYRCTDKILELANRLVKRNPNRHDKRLIAHKQSAVDVRFPVYPDEKSEAENIVMELHYLIHEKNVRPSAIAILFRTNEQPRIFETEFRRRDIRYVLLGSQSFFDRKEIRDILAYLKVMQQPADEVALRRIINTPARGIGNTTIEKLAKIAVTNGESLWKTLGHPTGDFSKKALTAIKEFRELIEKYQQQFEQHPTQMAQTLRKLIEEIQYEDEIDKQYKEGQQRLVKKNMLDQCVEAVKEYIGRSKKATLLGFLEDSMLDPRENDSEKEDQLKQEAVKLMTLHSAKGLEFPHVYLVGMEEGILPHKRAVEEGGDSISEERRLAYVGVTRAMDHLTLSRAAHRTKWGKRQPTLPSRFLYEMKTDEELPQDQPETNE
ncbi:ATP-dependent DNA helicase UvrD/PcrA [hydrothermal vent metagenome]|uniref:DNA 3'-5' helicase n=1 Tax=hydrothermal vent metagenome TaxID=652676 RepID=A0A3B1DUF7_9ZZZZ